MKTLFFYLLLLACCFSSCSSDDEFDYNKIFYEGFDYVFTDSEVRVVNGGGAYGDPEFSPYVSLEVVCDDKLLEAINNGTVIARVMEIPEENNPGVFYLKNFSLPPCYTFPNKTTNLISLYAPGERDYNFAIVFKHLEKKLCYVTKEYVLKLYTGEGYNGEESHFQKVESTEKFPDEDKLGL